MGRLLRSPPNVTLRNRREFMGREKCCDNPNHVTSSDPNGNGSVTVEVFCANCDRTISTRTDVAVE